MEEKLEATGNRQQAEQQAAGNRQLATGAYIICCLLPVASNP
jgi:hypothetical protein